jgi:hypothetical protein
MRYTAHTIDGSVIFSADDAQRIADKCVDHMRGDRRPHIGYVFDSKPNQAFPFTVYTLNRDGGPIAAEGTLCRDFAEVCKAWGI